jgi:hypothetical protein
MSAAKSDSLQRIVRCDACGWPERRDRLRRKGWLLCADGVRLCSFQCQCDYRDKGKRYTPNAPADLPAVAGKVRRDVGNSESKGGR